MEHPVSRGAMRMLYEQRRRKCTLTYEQLERLLANPHLAMRDIAARGGVSRAALHALCARYIAPVSPQLVRKTAPRVGRQRELADALAAMPPESPIVLTANAARAAGLSVEAVGAGAYGPEALVTRLKINGHLCSVRHSVYVAGGDRTSYYAVTLVTATFWRVDAVVAVVYDRVEGDCRFLIIPSTTLRKLSRQYPGKYLGVHIPLRHCRLDYHHGVRWRQWKPYENAWHLLG